jgi:signal transduction histidine kinase/ActR/RegA family two-component response regulator
VPGSNASVLVVDDDPDHRFLIERALRDAGYEVRAVERGSDALTVLDDVDLMLLDYRLPDMSGLEVLKAVTDVDGPSVVMVTAMGSEHVAVEAMRSGAVDYVVKDANYLQHLPQVIKRAFRLHDLSRRARLMSRITLLVNSSLDRVAVSREILRGARQVLRADAAGLYMLAPDGEVDEILDGVAPGTATGVRNDAKAVLLGTEPKNGGDDRLLMPLPEHEGRRLGVLAVLTEAPRHWDPEELRLAETFAAFAGIALANAARLDLERALVSELQQTLDLRRAMVMSLSHELRTPLTCIRGFAETMIGHWEGLDEKTRRDAVVTISQHADDLQRLVEQLLDFGALETGRLEAQPEPVNLHVEVSSTLAALAPMIGGRAIDVDVEDVTVMADTALLRRALANLVSNAVKFSGPQGHIAIVGRAEASAARITVSDSGKGLSAEEAAHVFEPFWRSRSTVSSATRGSGIGLALVQEYVRVMGGEVSVASVPGEGSRFSFTLPLAAAVTEPTRAPVAPAASA